MYRTIMVVEVLGSQPFTGDLSDLSHAITFGDFSGDVLTQSSRELTRDEMRTLLTMQGRDPDFVSG